MDVSLIFPIIASVISVGGVFIAIGMFKTKITENSETIKGLVPKNEFDAAIMRGDERLEQEKKRSEYNLAQAIKRSDEMLELMIKRAEEDRANGQGKYREFYALLNEQKERIITLEAQQAALAKSLGEFKGELKSGVQEIKDELKELQKQVMNQRNA